MWVRSCSLLLKTLQCLPFTKSFLSLPKSFPLTKRLHVIWPQVGPLILLPFSPHFAHFTPATLFFKHTGHHLTQGLDSFGSHLDIPHFVPWLTPLLHLNLCSDVICSREAVPDSPMLTATLPTPSSSLPFPSSTAVTELVSLTFHYILLYLLTYVLTVSLTIK